MVEVNDYKEYTVFNVGEHNTILPIVESILPDFAIDLWNRSTGDRIVAVCDINENGRPDDGDLGITATGEWIEDVRFTGDSFKYATTSQTLFGFIINTHLYTNKRSSITYNITNIDDTGPLAFAVSMAASLEKYRNDRWEEGKAIGNAITDNPALSTGIATAGALLALHPKGRIVLEGIGITGSAIGTGYFIYDRIDGIANGSEVGKHDLSAMLAMAGGAGSLRGMNAGAFFSAPIRALTRIFPKGGSGPFLPELCYATAGRNGGALALEAPLVASTEQALGIGNSNTSMLPIFSGIMLRNVDPVITSPAGKQFQISDKAFPKLHTWEGSEAENAANEIRAAMEMAAEDSGATEELAELNKLITALEEIYSRAPKDKVRTLITNSLKTIQADIETAINNDIPMAKMSELISKHVQAKFKTVIDVALKEGTVSERSFVDFLMSVKSPKPKPGLVVPRGMALHPNVEIEAKRGGLTSWVQKAINRIAGKESGGILKPVRSKAARMGVSTEVRFDEGPGYRIYVGQHNGKTTVLRAGIKKTQEHDLRIAARRAAEIGAALFVVELGSE